ncbi:Rhomboid-like protein 11 [Citrus sinensis]|uniref:Rhomboid-like protein 11 n=1 Tax=Citrus sinensis TaxID=2711 RepID=A0ACB8L5S0_CITSI|nr:Rhomboid-like protein 11 [Citrus sinensis]
MKKLLEKYCNHLSSNLFFFYIFGKLVEEEEGNFILWLSYNFTGATANSVSCVGASGAVFGLFAISDWWKILEVLILANLLLVCFALWVMEEAQASAGMSGTFIGGYSVQSINHITILSGALFGVFLVWLLSTVPSQSLQDKASNLHEKRQNFVTKLTNMLYKRTELLVTAVNLNC